MGAALERYGVYIDSIVSWLIGLPIVPAPLRVRILDRRSDHVDRRARLFAGSSYFGNRLTIDAHAFINSHCIVEAHAPVRIGARAHLGRGVQIVTLTHAIEGSEQRAGRSETAPVTIGPGAWLGAGTIVLPGVTVGAGAVVAAGSVVTGDVEADSLYAGAPAVKKRDLRSAPSSTDMTRDADTAA